MVYRDPFVRLTWKFVVNGTDEIAETTVAVSSLSPLTFVANFQADPTVGSAFITHMTNLLNGGSRWADYSRLSSVKAAPISVAGDYLGDAAEYVAPVPIAGTFPSIPPQCSTVMSLRSASDIGEATKGRMYLPHTTWPFALGDYRGTPAACSSQASALFDFVQNMNTTVDLVEADSRLIINSKKGLGAANLVIAARCKVGDLVDTQRRRRNRLPEVYYAG